MVMVQLAVALMIYSILGGAFPIGQLFALEVGRYEIWSHRNRLIMGAALYFAFFTLATAILLIVNWDFYILPWILMGLLILEKTTLNRLNKLMPEKFQPSEEELREKYGELFKVDKAAIDNVLEDEFTKKLGFGSVSGQKPGFISFLKGEGAEDDEGLTKAIEGYMEKEKSRRRRGDAG